MQLLAAYVTCWITTIGVVVALYKIPALSRFSPKTQADQFGLAIPLLFQGYLYWFVLILAPLAILGLAITAGRPESPASRALFNVSLAEIVAGLMMTLFLLVCNSARF